MLHRHTKGVEEDQYNHKPIKPLLLDGAPDPKPWWGRKIGRVLTDHPFRRRQRLQGRHTMEVQLYGLVKMAAKLTSPVSRISKTVGSRLGSSVWSGKLLPGSVLWIREENFDQWAALNVCFNITAAPISPFRRNFVFTWIYTWNKIINHGQHQTNIISTSRKSEFLLYELRRVWERGLKHTLYAKKKGCLRRQDEKCPFFPGVFLIITLSNTWIFFTCPRELTFCSLNGQSRFSIPISQSPFDFIV